VKESLGPQTLRRGSRMTQALRIAPARGGSLFMARIGQAGSRDSAEPERANALSKLPLRFRAFERTSL